MPVAPIILDHVQGIAIDPENAPFANYQAFASSYEGLKTLAFTVREIERRYVASDQHAEHVVLHMSSQVPNIVPCAFNWFSVTLVNYLRLIGLVQLMNANGWKSPALADPSNRSSIRSHCTAYVKSAVPEVYGWRNKVAAHFAATDPFHDDNLGTLEHSLMSMVTFQYPHYHVGLGKWVTGTEISQLPQWALTKVYEDLRTRYWPEVQLPPVKP
ncbi:MAG: hypothetical protein C0453_04495 [Comamonadaceae bacterium]|nr:hypothetical protein [Comamonadaceae bacterium]